MCTMTHSRVCYDSFVCVMTHSYVCHDSLIWAPWLNNTCTLTETNEEQRQKLTKDNAVYLHKLTKKKKLCRPRARGVRVQKTVMRLCNGDIWHQSILVETQLHKRLKIRSDKAQVRMPSRSHMRWLQLVGSLNLQVSFAKEPYKRDYVLQKRPIILRSLLIAATP